MSACCEETNYFFPAFGRAMSTVQLWMEIRSALPESQLFSGRIIKTGLHVKTRRCQVQVNNMHSIWRRVWKYFHADESIIQSLLKKNISRLEFSHIFVFWDRVFFVWKYEFSPELHTGEPRIYDVLRMWRVLLLLIMNDRLILASRRVFVWISAFISMVYTIIHHEKCIVCNAVTLPHFEIHFLCSVMLTVGQIRTCKALLCNIQGHISLVTRQPHLCAHSVIIRPCQAAQIAFFTIL